MGTAWENGGKILENGGTYGFHMINLNQFKGTYGNIYRRTMVFLHEIWEFPVNVLFE
jgi:hypothetical protein